MAFISTTHRPSVAEYFRGLAARYREARARRALYRQTVAELSRLSDRDLADLGISRLTIHDLAAKHAYGK
ncbi:MAG: DUF1127 domain-containing protein [Rhodobacteraceae bacterium]|nr:DUF1127 domain-containing protein [Paracoccaceae bacterium]